MVMSVIFKTAFFLFLKLTGVPGCARCGNEIAAMLTCERIQGADNAGYK